MSVHISIEDAQAILELFEKIRERAPKSYHERNLALLGMHLSEEIRLETVREKRRERYHASKEEA